MSNSAAESNYGGEPNFSAVEPKPVVDGESAREPARDKNDKTVAEQAKDASKGAAVVALGAFAKKAIRRKAIKQLLKRKKVRKSARKVIRALIKEDVVTKKDVRKLVGKKAAKKLVA